MSLVSPVIKVRHFGTCEFLQQLFGLIKESQRRPGNYSGFSLFRLSTENEPKVRAHPYEYGVEIDGTSFSRNKAPLWFVRTLCTLQILSSQLKLLLRQKLPDLNC